ncbi:MAG: hypothetical protein KJ011_05250 [Burkholderiaceae bacterium]|nr:hypothetical protein [Burkholderiaceae bacterium]
MAGNVAEAMAGAGGVAGMGRGLTHAAGPVAQRVGAVMAGSPGTQVVAAGSGAGAAWTARELGASPAVQIGAGLVGAMAPTVGPAIVSEPLRRLLRGSDPSTMQRNIEMFRQAGTSPTVGQAADTRLTRGIESVLSKTPGGAGVMARKAAQEADDLSATINRLSTGLSPRATAADAGESIGRSVQGFRDGIRRLQTRLYSTLDQHIVPSTPIAVMRTRQALNQLNAGVPGAPNLSRVLGNAKLAGIDDALAADLQRSTQTGTLPYAAIKRLRMLVGEQLTDAPLVSDVTRGQWKALYGALSDDLGAAANAAGPQARDAWRWANSFTRNSMERLEQLAPIVGKDSPEKVYRAAMSGTAEGATTIKRVFDAIPKIARRDVAAAVIGRMGRAAPGRQDELGEVFSPETFLSNWNRLSPDVKTTLFDRLGVSNVREVLEKVAGVAANMREGSQVFANPSGTQAAISAQLTGLGAGGAALMGHYGTAAGLASVPVLANAGAHLTTNPAIVGWLARNGRIPPALTSAFVGLLGQDVARPPFRAGLLGEETPMHPPGAQ